MNRPCLFLPVLPLQAPRSPPHDRVLWRASVLLQGIKRMSAKHLTQIELSQRWNLSHRTLERWRWQGKGPAYLKLGRRVAYEIPAIEAFEQSRRQLSDVTSQTGEG